MGRDIVKNRQTYISGLYLFVTNKMLG